MHAAPLIETAVRTLLAEPSPEAAVAVLRAADEAGETARRRAIAELDEHLRSRPEHREQNVASTLIALRRAGLSS